MARITVEDCLDKVDNRFDLVMLATKRARQLATGGKEPLVQVDSDKVTVIALREIAEGLVHKGNIDVRVASIFEDDDDEISVVASGDDTASETATLSEALNTPAS